MIPEHEYDFEFLDDQLKDADLDPRPNFRIGPCCLNCRYFYCARNKGRRGFCKLPLNKRLGTFENKGESYNSVEKKTPWLRSHSTNLCDRHTYKSFVRYTRNVIRWTGINFNAYGDGEVIEDV